MSRSSFEIVNRKKATKLQQPTVIIFPGIHENNVEVKELGLELHKQSGEDRRIITYNGWINQNPDASSLTQKTHPIAKEIKHWNAPYQPYPVWLVAYSFGCTIAYEIAIKLKTKGLDPHVIFIDGTAPNLAHQYFNSKHINLTKDIIALFNSAARAFHLTELKPDSNTLAGLNSLPTVEQIDWVIAAITTSNQKDTASKQQGFKQSAEKVKQNALLLLGPSSYNNQPKKLDKINVLMTNETKEKYASALGKTIETLTFGGWENYANSVSGWEQYQDDAELQQSVNRLIQQPHTSLMKEDVCKELSLLVNRSIKKEVSEEDFLIRTITAGLSGYKKQYPGVNAPQVLETIKTSLSAGSSEVSSISESPPENKDEMEMKEDDGTTEEMKMKEEGEVKEEEREMKEDKMHIDDEVSLSDLSAGSSPISNSPIAEGQLTKTPNNKRSNIYRLFTPDSRYTDYSDSRSNDDHRKGLLRSPCKPSGSPF